MKILICTNGKKNAEEAIKFGCKLFKKNKIDATILCVSDDKSKCKNYLDRAKKITSEYGIPAKTKIRLGDFADKIEKESKEGKYDLVIVGYKNLSEELKSLKEIFISKIIENLTQEITTSILVVKSPKREIKRVLICIDGSKDSEKAVNFFGSLKKDFNPQIDLINVIPEVYHRFRDILEPLAEEQLKVFTKLPGERTKHLYNAKDILAKYKLDSNILLKEGNFVEEMINISDQDYDLLVLGARGRNTQDKETIGRNVRKIIRDVQIPVLVIHK